MADVSRRGFLTQVSIATGVGVAGGLGLHKLLPEPSAPSISTDLTGVTIDGPVVLHVRDIVSGEVAVMIGTQELVYRDTELVSRLVRTATARREG
jgi:hypothetical protein